MVALGAAIYLNWQFSGNKALEVTNVLDSSSDELGEARYVNNANFSDKQQQGTDISDKTKKYFAEVQINRQKTREESIEKLKTLLSTPDINPEGKETIKKTIDSISKNSIAESNIENLVKSKGFNECVVCIENDECSVIVNPGSVNEKSAVIIKDIVSGQTNIQNNKIKIIEAK